MPTWKSRGLRGSALEDMINYTIEQYSTKKLALIQKIPTPIKPINIDQETRHITLAYFDQKSTVDYIGAVQGIPICFDAKESAVDTFPLQNIHEHPGKIYAGNGRNKTELLLFCCIIRTVMKRIMCRFLISSISGTAAKMAEERVLHMTRSIRHCRFQ